MLDVTEMLENYSNPITESQYCIVCHAPLITMNMGTVYF